jgi:mono/diheme cytochrome c family protein
MLGVLLPATSIAQERTFELSAPKQLVETGLLKHILPRFSLKTGIKVQLVPDEAEPTVSLNRQRHGQPVFNGPDNQWYLEIHDLENSFAARFSDWLASEIGARTIEAFKISGKQVFNRPVVALVEKDTDSFEGNPDIGEAISLRSCGRCHVVSKVNKMKAIGSTPSFALLRTFEDWSLRFGAFFALKPHPAFTQIEGVTEPFDPSRPSPISPLELTLEELNTIIAFVARIEPADLGAPLQNQ